MEEKKIFVGFAVVSFVLFLVAVYTGFSQEGTPAEQEVAVTEVEAPAPATEETAEAAPAPEPTAEVAEASEEDSAAASEAAPDETAEAAPAPVKDESGFSVGETAVFDDGAVRVFVARLDAENGQARLSVNGDSVALGAGEALIVSAGATDCSVALDALTSQSAELSATCGDALPAPEGIGVGETAVLMDGQLRVFASKVDTESARLSLNGALVTLPVGGSARADLEGERCHVTLASVDRGHASVDATCAALPARSDLAGPGSTAVLTAGETAARVFVSSVDNRSDSVRLAVNGLDTTMTSEGDGITLEGGCEIVVEEVSDGQASFSLACRE
ncbi:MAG: hypothetical protein AAF999_13090 [Pseudomonadota bacterium]